MVRLYIVERYYVKGVNQAKTLAIGERIEFDLPIKSRYCKIAYIKIVQLEAGAMEASFEIWESTPILEGVRTELYKNILRRNITMADILGAHYGESLTGNPLPYKDRNTSKAAFPADVDDEQGTVTVDVTAGASWLDDTLQDFRDYEVASGLANYVILVIDAGNNDAVGWAFLGAELDGDGTKIEIFNGIDTDIAPQSWGGTAPSVGPYTYVVREAFQDPPTIGRAINAWLLHCALVNEDGGTVSDFAVSIKIADPGEAV